MSEDDFHIPPLPPQVLEEFSRLFRVTKVQVVELPPAKSHEMAIEVHYSRWNGQPAPSPAYLVLDAKLARGLGRSLLES